MKTGNISHVRHKQEYWIAMGDLCGGKKENQESLVWQFRELADKNSARIAFYQVSQDNLPLYLDLGLVLILLGEEGTRFSTGFRSERGQAFRTVHDQQQIFKTGPEVRCSGSQFLQVHARMSDCGMSLNPGCKQKK